MKDNTRQMYMYTPKAASDFFVALGRIRTRDIPRSFTASCEYDLRNIVILILSGAPSPDDASVGGIVADSSIGAIACLLYVAGYTV